MRILLINPPGEHPIQSEVPAPVNREVCLLPPLGLLYLESYLAAHHPEHDVRVMDSRAECLSHEDVSRLIGEFQPRVVGITGHTYDLIDMRETSRRRTSFSAAQPLPPTAISRRPSPLSLSVKSRWI